MDWFSQHWLEAVLAVVKASCFTNTKEKRMLVEKEKANEKEKEKAINITSSSHSGVLRHISIFFFKRKRSWSGFSIHISKNNVFLHRHMCFSKRIWWLCIELDNPLKKEGAPHSIKKIVSPPFERGYTPSLTARCTSSKTLLEVLSQIHMLLINDFLFLRKTSFEKWWFFRYYVIKK